MLRHLKQNHYLEHNWKHDKYKAKYPEGYELIWLVEEDPRFKPFIEMVNNKKKDNL